MKFAMLLDYSNSCVLTKMCNFVAELVILLAGTLCNFEKAGLLQQETMFQALISMDFFCVLFSFFWKIHFSVFCFPISGYVPPQIGKHCVYFLCP